MDEAQQASAAGATDHAIRLLKSALEAEPDNPQVLNLLANRLLAVNDPAAACELLERATAIDPQAEALWLNLANAERQRQNAAAEEAALDRALTIQPYLVPALLQKGDLYERQGRVTDASRSYSAVLTIVARMESVPPALEARLVHARELVERH